MGRTTPVRMNKTYYQAFKIRLCISGCGSMTVRSSSIWNSIVHKHKRMREYDSRIIEYLEFDCAYGRDDACAYRIVEVPVERI